ncbi:MAG: flagellar export protein FliJ [Planctomycetota bacterium]|nr:MAG: flagellar export protein FliJ [Planctomycetota bacterium]
MSRRFRFRLETLLRVRQLREDEATRRLAQQQAEIARIDAQKAELLERIREIQTELLARQSTACPEPADLARRRAWVAHLRRRIADGDRLRAEKSEQLERLRDAWRTARTQKRVIEKLRERRAAEHRHAARRREQRDAWELAQRLHVHGGGDIEGVRGMVEPA